MKKKFSKILGVGLTVMLLASLLVAVAPVAADPGVLKWSKMPFPKAGKDGDYFRDADIDVVGPLAKAIDGSLFAYAEVGRDPLLFKSDDDGRTWSKTKYDAAGGEEIVAIVPSSEDADIVYVADATTVWKSTDVASKSKWKKLASDSLDDLLAGNEDITSLDVGYTDDDPFVFIGTATGTSAGDVYYLDEAAYGSVWEELNVDIDATEGWDVYALACDPNFDDTSGIIAVVTDGTETWVTNNSGTPGAWTDDAELWPGDDEDANLEIKKASRIGFPDDFDVEDAYELFVGVVAAAGEEEGSGDVYRVLPEIAYDLDVDDMAAGDGIISLDLVGAIGDTLLLAGQYGDNEVYRSTDDGDSWKDSKKEPTGTGPTYVLVADDFADSEEAWAATTSNRDSGGAISFTVAGGNLWNQISLIGTDLDTVESLTFGSDRFMVTTTDEGPTNNDVWKYDGTNWERVENKADVDLVQVSAEYASDDTVFIADSSTAEIWRSTDGGGRFKQQPTGTWKGDANISAWLILDKVTVIASDGDDIWKTKDNARTAWKDKGDGNLVSFALSPDFDDDETIIAGDDAGEVHRSTNAGDKWKKVSTATAILPSEDTYVAFDPEYADNETIYGAAGAEVARWDGDDWDEMLTTDSIDAFEAASGLVASADGTLYATDSDGFEGMARSLKPTASKESKADWENVTKGNAPNLDSLQLTAGSNVLWGLDESEAKVWTYEDTLTGSVSLTSPSDGASSGRTDSASLSWAELDGAKEYQIKLNTRSDFNGEAITVDNVEVEAARATGLEDGKTYYWKVRVAEGEPVLSRWSDVWSFTTAMGAAQWTPFFIPGNVAPSAGDTDVPLRPTFMWNPADWATGYEFELSTKPGTTARGYFVDVLVGMTGTNALGPGVTVWESDRDLDYSTTYFWHVKAISPTTSSEWATGVFTTIGPPVPPAPPPPPPPPPPDIVIPPVEVITPAYIWAIVIIGAVLVIAVIVLIVRTRRVA